MAEIENIDSATRDAAAEALAAGLQETDTSDFTGEPDNEPAPVVSQDDPTQQEAPSQDQQPASREIDLSGLSQEARDFIQARERELTADYTRKTQEAAQQRQEAEQAIQFIEALNNDPNFAQQVYEALGQTIQPDEPDYGFDEDPYSEFQDDPYAEKLAELEQWKSQLEQQFEEAQWNAHVDRSLADVRTANPDWTDEDLNDVIGLGFATQGDLYKAADMLSQIKNRVVSSYVESKSSVQAPSILPNASAQVPPEGFDGIEDKRLHEAAMQVLRAELG